MPKFLRSRTYYLVVVIIGVACVSYSAYRVYANILVGDQLRIFSSGALTLWFAILTINNYINLRRHGRPDEHTNIT